MFSRLFLATAVLVLSLNAFPSFADDAKGILRVIGQPGDGQPATAFLQKCRVDESGNLEKFSCGKGSVFEALFEANLNADTVLPAGRYSLSYDLIGSDLLIDVSAGHTTSVRLERVDFPEGTQPADVRVIADLTNAEARARYLLTAFSIDSFRQYLFERNRGDVPNTPANQKFFSGMEHAKTPDDLLNLLVKIDGDGYAFYWNVYHDAFIGSNGVHAPSIWAGETGHFVAVLPGNIYSILVYGGDSTTPTKIIRGVHSEAF